MEADHLAEKATHADPFAVSPSGFEELSLVSSSPPIEAMPARAITASSPEPDEPDDKENGCDDPQEMQCEPHCEEQQDNQ